ncbi:MAG: hypothetical protein ABUS56_07160 [Acidobacteriota bacterium]
MTTPRTRVAVALAALLTAAISGPLLLRAGTAVLTARVAAQEPASVVTPIYEGWFKNPDGTFSLVLGYTNTDAKVPFDIPVGPDNSIEPGGPDRGQPTHFNPHRQWGTFAVVVPATFAQGTLTWTVVANGTRAAVAMALDPRRELAMLADPAGGGKAPLVRFDPNGRATAGPPSDVIGSMRAVVGQPVPLAVWVADDTGTAARQGAGDAPMVIRWSRFRGPGIVRFTDPTPPVDPAAGGRATTNATFLAAGEYVMRGQTSRGAADSPNGPPCCWTGALVKVAVAPAPPQ